MFQRANYKSLRSQGSEYWVDRYAQDSGVFGRDGIAYKGHCTRILCPLSHIVTTVLDKAF